MSTAQLSRNAVEVRTRGFARVLGPFFFLVSVVTAARAPHMRELLDEFTTGQLWSWIMGTLLLVGGIGIVAFHQYWSNVAACIVSTVGWLLILRSMFLLAFPEQFANVASHIVGSINTWRAAYLLVAGLGLYLTYVGWRREPGNE